MQYLLMIYGDESAMANATPENRQVMTEAYATFTKGIVQSGHFKGGERLHPTKAATTVRVRDGKTMLIDGPFAETREQLAGYYVIDARNLDEATAIAASVPADHVITAAVSDWAGYALAAAISFVSGKANAAVSGDQLRQLLWRAVDTGLIDGSGYAIPAVDGVGVDYNARLAATLADIVSLPVQTKERFARMFDLAIELRRTAVAAD